MAEDRLHGPRLKIERANKHIADLEAAIKRFHATDPYRGFREVNREASYLEHGVYVLRTPPEHLATIAGDAIHNLRSALDLLWCQLVEAHGKRISQSDLFLISGDQNSFEAAFKHVKKRIPVAASSIVAAIKPYKGGHDGLWRLNELDIIDKHRLLLAVSMNNEAVIMRFRFPDVPGREGPLPTVEFGLRPAVGRVEGRAVLLVLPLDDEAHEDPKFRIDIALDEPTVGECEPIVPLLTQLRGAVDDVVDLFADILAT